MSKTKILFIVNVDWFFLSHRLPIALKALDMGYEVHLACAQTKPLDALSAAGINVHPIGMKRGPITFFSDFLVLIKIFFLIRDVRPDILHLVTIKPIIFGGLVARLLSVPRVVFAIAGLGYGFSVKGVLSLIRKFFLIALYRVVLNQKRKVVIFQNLSDIETISSFFSLPGENCRLVKGSGVNLFDYNYTPIPQGVPIVMFASRLLMDKGVEDFVNAAKFLNHRDIRFVIVGAPDKGNPTSVTLADLANWTSRKNIEWWGYKDDMEEVIKLATIVVFPSYYNEGIPKILLEAASSGRPVITTDQPGCRDAIEDGVTGLLVPIKNPRILAQRIEYLILNPDLMAEMGKNARKLAEESFDVNAIVKSHMEIYSDLLR